jgi:hypothetical protein
MKKYRYIEKENIKLNTRIYQDQVEITINKNFGRWKNFDRK